MKHYEEAVTDYEKAYTLFKSTWIEKLMLDAKLALKNSKQKNYYNILGIEKHASDLEIKNAYHKRALMHHPDRHVNASEEVKREHEEIFKEVCEAYTILSNHIKKDYDREF